MTTQNVLTQAMGMFNTGKGSNLSKGNAVDRTGFDQVMGKTMKADNKMSGETKAVSDNTGSKETRWESKVAEKNNVSAEKEPVETIAEDRPSKVESEENTVKEVSAKTDNTDVVAAESEVDLEAMEEAMSELQAQIMAIMQDTLNISLEQLEQAMDKLGLDPIDLLDSANTSKLILELNGMDNPTQLLTDQRAFEQLNQVNEQLKAITLSEQGVSKEDLLKFMEKLPEEMKEAFQKGDFFTDNIQPQVKDGESKEEMVKVEEPVKDEASDAKITVTVEKEASHSGETRDFSRDRRRDNQSDGKGAMETFVENLAMKGQNLGEVTGRTIERVEMMREIVNQVVEQIKVTIRPEATTMEMQLNPENLGKINIAVTSQNGQLTATFTTQNELTKEALENQIQVLRDTLNNQGLKVEAIEVTVSNFAFDFNQNDQMSGDQNQSKNQGRKKIDLSEFDEGASGVTEEEILAARILEQNGGSVEYLA